VIAVMPWNVAADVPWQVFSSPAARWAELPSFVVCEYLFFALTALSLWHAWREGRGALTVWVAALIAGTASDLIFMALPLVDNFWHAQATVMLTPRLPLYIPCVYVCFLYLPTMAVRRVGLPPLAGAALTGLAAIAFYAPFDIVGAKLLWWTWHDTDPPIAHRILGAPIGSTTWVIVFSATFAWLVGRVLDRDPAMAPRSVAKALAAAALLATPLMMVQMTVLQQLGGGVPGPVPLAVVVVCYAALAGVGARRATAGAPTPHDRALFAGIAAHLVALVAVLALSDPAQHVSESMHQEYGPCHVEARDITGQVRFAYVCAEDFDEDYTFDCVDELPADGAHWYTVCGRPHTNRALWLGGTAGIVAVAIGLYGALLMFRRRRRPA
jgi:hypothetical protein